MLEAAFFAIIIYFVYRQLTLLNPRPASQNQAVATKTVSPKIQQLSEYAARLYDERKFLMAEKTYLEILRIDHKHVQAYNRLGLIAAALKKREDAIESFRMVSQLAPSAQSYHNLGLAYYENKNYIKAIAAFEKAIMFEANAARYIAMAKAYQRILNKGKMLAALEKACELEPSQQNLTILADAYAYHRETHKARSTYERVLKLDPANQKAKRALSVASLP
jgi:tetratricopeptide (TPR) repeat protein